MRLLNLIFFLPAMLLGWSPAELLEECQDPDKPWEWNYQNILMNGQIVLYGYGPDGPSRYEAIRPILQKYKRPFTVLDIAANNGYFDFRILQEFDATCVMIDQVKGLSAICAANTEVNQNLIELKKYLSLEEMIRLSECEHFDVVLIFNLIHHFPEWKKWIDAARELGDHLFIEVPPSTDPLSGATYLQEMYDYLISLPNSKIIAYTPRRPNLPHILSPMFWIQTNKNRLLRKSWQAPLAEEEGIEYLIKSDWDHKQLTIHKGNQFISHPWIRGIHLSTYMHLNGSFPFPREAIEENDNSVIQGKNICLLQ